jgi:phosphoglucosamine mutase
MKVFPQVIKNIHVREKRPFESIPAEVMRRFAQAEEELEGNRGGLSMRYSGN